MDLLQQVEEVLEEQVQILTFLLLEQPLNLFINLTYLIQEQLQQDICLVEVGVEDGLMLVQVLYQVV